MQRLVLEKLLRQLETNQLGDSFPRTEVYDYPILSAKSTSGLVFKDNKIVQSIFRSPGHPKAGFDFTASTKVEIKNNHFEDYETPRVELYKMKKKDIRSDIPTTIK